MKDTPSQVAAVQVAVRIRPLTDRDRALPRFANSTNQDVLRANENHVQIVPQNRYFTYDYVFGTDTEQQTIFSRLGEKPVERFIEGYNVTILAYGQTSSGKTYTMGTAQHTDSTVTFEEEGIIPRAMSLLFDMLNKQQQQQVSQTEPIEKLVKSIRPPSSQSVSQRRNSQQQLNSNHRYTLKVSFVEIYNEELVDLLNSSSASERPPITIREDTKGHIYWTGVKEMIVHNTSDVLNFLQQGTNNRATGSTDMNEKSSRSHAIFSVTLKQEKRAPSSTQSSRSQSPAPIKNQQSKSQRISLAARYSSSSNINHMNNNDDGEWIVTTSKFHFVDLAGSERLKRTAAEGDRRKEGININAGLLALGNVISALGDPSKRNTHVPYRDSKLTRLLQDSLGGSAMTLMIACVSPAESNLSETLNTLQYANRARNIKNKLEKNEMEEWMVTDNIDLLRTTITKLKNELRLLKSMNNANSNNNNLKLDNCTRHLSDTSDDFSLTSSSPVANPDPDDAYYGQHILIQDLQHQVEALQNEAEFAKERNIVVESELRRLHEERDAPNKYDFQHLVEPVIEEYEKSMSALESKLALAQAALSHSDQVHEELMTKIAYYEDTIEKLENVIQDLQRRIGKLLERRLKDENYITELEKKLMVSVEETIHDRELLSELRGKILKFKEVDETTEQYIQELENRLNISEAECNSLREEVKAMKATDKDTDTCKKPITNHDTVSNYKKEMDVLQQKNAASEQECQTLRAEVDKLLLELEKRPSRHT
ncbi:P-loop containing nucleoside triphosphate hydrolase protein [Mycotypha africana]|uniref:P-loop containing nucleoside triphosphate hydrolase protein n=1 Tax=Mycotypha africana TaxID=64632 RepID=UPI00230069E0|nr:P-loop containing nucleoside triphosphate hydrolase protein [Mycotypha africana]KAI8975459.1 P-loop containing nucleoside triphosphate hydrolase protein [Mycotypha africana]